MLRDKTAGKVFSKLKISTAKVRAARGPPQTEEEVQKQRADRIEKRDARRLAISQKYGGAIKSTNVISSLCAIRDLITVAKVAVKVTLAADEARAAMNTVGRPGDTIKAGLATGDNQTSNALANAASILNEEDKNGKVATDSYGYQYASRGVLIKDKGNQEDYQLGVNGKGVLGDIANASQGVSGLSTVTAGVNKVLNQEVCTVAGIASLALCLATVGFGCAINGAASIALQAIALPLILKKLIKTPDVETAVGGDKGDAITGGFSYLTKTNNQYHGGYPLTKNQAIRYDTFSDNAQNGGNWEESTAFDIHNTDSFAGKLASAFLPSMARMSTSPSSIPTTLTHLASSNLSHTASTAQAASVIDGEYDQCKDADYKALDLATDPFCVPQYGFNPSLMLGDSDYNKPSAALEDDEKPKESGFSLAWLFETPTAQAAVDNRGGFIPDNRYDADLVVNFMHDGAKPWIDDEGTGISYDDSDDDYIDYSKECLETTDPLEPSSPDMCKPKKCTEASSGSNEFRYCMYSVYAGDSSIDDQLEDRDASGGGGDSDANNEDTSSSGEAGEVKALAQELLDNPNVTYPYTDTRGVNVREVLQEVARTGKGIVNSPDVSFDRVEVSPDMLQAIADYAKNNKIGLNALTNADHSSGSNHYKGIAVDFACNPPFNRLEFEQIAAKYGGKNNGEVCPGAAHWHYDFPKRGTN